MYRILIVGTPVFYRQINASAAVKKLNAQIDCMSRSELEKALNSDRTLYWDLLVADFESFHENDMALLHSIKNEKVFSSSIVVDSELTPEKMKQAFLLGAFDYLLKPLDDAVFLEALKRCLVAVDALDRTNKISLIEQALIAAVSGGNLKAVQEKLPIYYNQVSRYSNDRMANIENTLMKTSFQVYCEVMKQYPWIEKFICNYNVFKEKFLTSSSRQELFAVFESYLRQIADTIHTLFHLSDNAMIKKVCLYILEHSDVRISLSTVAQHCFLNKTYLSHTFKVETDISFVDYITLVKMARAKILFLEGGLKVFEISSMLGFSDTGYFCKIFKKTQGITPNQYKSKLKLSQANFHPGEKSPGYFGPQICPGPNGHSDIFSA